MKEVHAAPQGINATISCKIPSKSQKKLLGPPVHIDVVMAEADKSRVWDSGEDKTMDIDAVTRSSMGKGKVASAQNEDSTYFERMDLDAHANITFLGRNCHDVNYSGK